MRPLGDASAAQVSLGLGIPGPAAPTDRRAALALALADGVGPVRHRQWSADDGGAEQALRRRLTQEARTRALDAADRALDDGAACGATLVLSGETAYPGALLELADPPPALWLLGDASLLAPERAAVAVVGTRDATAYGDRAARSIAHALAESGVVVVSGMARGIDAAAHLAALDAGGATVAVLGCGVDVPYPRHHRALHRRLVERGLVVSELPPGSAPSPGAFPRRNRIVAALSRAAIIVEAGVRSGALITASLALELGRDVGAVPGPIDSATAAGTNALLRDGAAVIAEPADALALAGVACAASGRSGGEPPALDGDARIVWDALAVSAHDVDALCDTVGLPAPRCLAALGALEAAGHVRTGFDGTLSRT